MILSETEIRLTGDQEKFIESGWGSEALNNTEVRKILYDSDGYKVKGYLANPKVTNKKYPLIIWNRGGNDIDGKIDEFLARGIFGEIASWGYVVLASQYRDKDEFGGKDVNDILNLIPLAREISFCDAARIGMEGWSRGGMMAYRVLSMTYVIKCAVIISGLANLVRNEKGKSGRSQVYRRLFGSDDEIEFKRRKEERSAVCFAEKINKQTEILLIHGTADREVSYQDSEEMYELLKENGIKSELKLIEGGDHYLKRNRKEVVKLRKDFFDSKLGIRN